MEDDEKKAQDLVGQLGAHTLMISLLVEKNPEVKSQLRMILKSGTLPKHVHAALLQMIGATDEGSGKLISLVPPPSGDDHD